MKTFNVTLTLQLDAESKEDINGILNVINDLMQYSIEEKPQFLLGDKIEIHEIHN